MNSWTHTPIPSEPYRPGEHGEQGEYARELWRVDRECYPAGCGIALYVWKVLRLNGGEDENSAEEDCGGRDSIKDAGST